LPSWWSILLLNKYWRTFTDLFVVSSRFIDYYEWIDLTWSRICVCRASACSMYMFMAWSWGEGLG
jgi:hypothetical protein